MKATEDGDEVMSEDRLVLLDGLSILGMFKGEITDDYLDKHRYAIFNMGDIAVINNSDGKFVIGFECLYLYDYFQSALDVLKAFGFEEEDIEIYIPKKEYPMIITVSDNHRDKNGEKVYLVIAQRMVNTSNEKGYRKTKFLLREAR